MKNLFNAFKLFAIAIAMLGFGNRAMGQNNTPFEIADFGSVRYNAGTYTGIVTSTTISQSSTARLFTNGSVVLEGTYSDFYGFIRPDQGSTASFNQSTFGSKLEIGQSSYSGAAVISIDKGTGVTMSGSSGTDVITMDKYGKLDVQKDLTLTLGKIQLNNYDDANAPYIQFHPATTTPKITLSEAGMKILTNDATSNRIDASKHLKFDMTNATTGTIGTNNHFTVASFTATGDPVVTGSPLLSGNDDGLWESPTVDVNAHNLRLNVTFAPLFDINSQGSSYAGSLAGLSGRNESSFQTLLKDKELTGGYTATSNLLLDLQTYNLTGNQTITINGGKALGLKGAGNFTNVVNFANNSSELRLIGTFTADQMPSVAEVGSSGFITVGDGSTTSTFTVNSAAITKFNSKVSKIVVKMGATVTVTPTP